MASKKYWLVFDSKELTWEKVNSEECLEKGEVGGLFFPAWCPYAELNGVLFRIIDLFLVYGRSGGECLLQRYDKLESKWSTVSSFPLLARHFNLRMSAIDDLLYVVDRGTRHHSFTFKPEENESGESLGSWEKVDTCRMNLSPFFSFHI